MVSKVWLTALAGALVCELGWAAAEPPAKTPGPQAGIPELLVLDRYVGSWRFASTDPDRPAMTGVGRSWWVAGGRFLASEFTTSGGYAGFILRTYDPVAKVYRDWQFGSTGGVQEAVGRWEGKTSTLTVEAKRPNGMTVVMENKFVDADTVELTHVVRDKTGAIVNQSKSKMTREKP
jgi:hypothetical protein